MWEFKHRHVTVYQLPATGDTDMQRGSIEISVSGKGLNRIAQWATHGSGLFA